MKKLEDKENKIPPPLEAVARWKHRQKQVDFIYWKANSGRVDKGYQCGNDGGYQ